jgi:hypothetical protein
MKTKEQIERARTHTQERLDKARLLYNGDDLLSSRMEVYSEVAVMNMLDWILDNGEEQT